MGFTAPQMATASLGLSLAGAATSAIGSYYGARTQRANLEAQAALAESNARLAEMSAQSLLDQGQKNIARLTMKAGQLKGRQRAALAANGVDLGVGSAAEVVASADLMKEIDTLEISTEATRNAWAARTQGVSFQNDAVMRRAGASTISPLGAAAGSLMGSAGSVASNWYALNKTGALTGSMFDLK